MSNLKPWPKGVSGNPNGRPKGSQNLSTKIRKYLESNSHIEVDGKITETIPLDVLIGSITQRAIAGDNKACDWLAKYGYGTASAVIDSSEYEEQVFIVQRSNN